MRPRRVQGSPRGGPGARGVPSAAPGLDFGPPRAPFWAPFGAIFLSVFATLFGAISESFFGAVLDSLEVQIWDILETIRCPILVRKTVPFQRAFPGAPGHRHSVKKLVFHWRVV